MYHKEKLFFGASIWISLLFFSIFSPFHSLLPSLYAGCGVKETKREKNQYNVKITERPNEKERKKFVNHKNEILTANSLTGSERTM